ncbi:MAG: hypothetical protein PHC62_03865 [Candidatus Izemoplasmatales bacterium]|nr:hypothetical protein [Candidatus Izemoplasmatales bacterium]
MRKLNLDDCFDFMILIDELKLKDEIKKISINQKKEKVGFDIIWKTIMVVVGKKNRSAIYNFLSGPLEKPADEIRKMGIAKLIEELREVASVEEWQSFLNSLQQMT